jgi:hypothetical protein
LAWYAIQKTKRHNLIYALTPDTWKYGEYCPAQIVIFYEKCASEPNGALFLALVHILNHPIIDLNELIMQSKPTLGIALTLIAIIGITFAVFGYFMAFITQGVLIGCALLTWILFLAGITLLNRQMSDSTSAED